ncbi:unnamed protein product [Caenorhabditis auriculariae]|uniref:Acetyl-CoA carboxylase n=1 Tax=Caenorhabditis auriculariae TaxID=2777116 RepID=A0A8S1HEG2_9PELO|nr:unnamed protein product [Caenorhabditis auriculariae]
MNQDVVFDSIQDFLEFHVEAEEMRRPIRRILIATNGIAAIKAMQSIRSFLLCTFRNSKLVKFICIATTDEMSSSSEYLKFADVIVFSPAGSNKCNFANVEEIVSHAIENHADAVWAGWGHASENPSLPRKLKENGIAFMGPSSEAMFSLGDKIASTIFAQSLNVPTIEWSGSGVVVDLDKITDKLDLFQLDHHLFEEAVVRDWKHGVQVIQNKGIGFPLMIKASEGGGGKGIRKCTKIEEFKELFEQVAQEVPGSPIFLMKCVNGARHLEVQLVADRYGTILPLQTRDCSIQRRCQKVIEEAPASLAPSAICEAMQRDAVKIASLFGYESAGTIEYLYLHEQQKYYFLELNPRLQVEHPCTEMLVDVNIPAMQLQIAMGVPLHRVKSIRRLYELPLNGDCGLPRDVVLPLKRKRFVVAARITSENPDDYFRPSTGLVRTLNFRSSQDVWGYFSVSAGGRVHEFADSQFGHVFARGDTRHEAISTMISTLRHMELNTAFSNQVRYLIELLNDPTFARNRFHTQWLDMRISAKFKAKEEHSLSETIAISGAVIGHARVKKAFEDFKATISRGQILPPTNLTETVSLDLVKERIAYKVVVTRCSPTEYMVALNERRTQVTIVTLGNGKLLVTYGGHSFQCGLEETTDSFKVTIGAFIASFEKDNDPTVLKSPYTGKLLSYKKDSEAWIDVGETFATIESMKLVFNVEIRNVPGRLVRVANEGDLLFPGSVIAFIRGAEDAAQYRPTLFADSFKDWPQPKADSFADAYNKCKRVMHGSIPFGCEKEVEAAFQGLFHFLNSSRLSELVLKPLYENFKKSAPEVIRMSLDFEFNGSDEDAIELQKLVKDTNVHTDAAKRLLEQCEHFCGGNNSFISDTISELISLYIGCEKHFDGRTYDVAVNKLRQEVKNDDYVVSMIYAHMKLAGKNKLLSQLIQQIVELRNRPGFVTAKLRDRLRMLDHLGHAPEVVSEARRALYEMSCDEATEQLLLKPGSLTERQLEIYSLPEKSEKVSSPKSSIHVYQLADGRGMAKLFLRQIASLTEPIDSNEQTIAKIKSVMFYVLDDACSAANMFSYGKKKNFVGSSVFIYLRTPYSEEIPGDCVKILKNAIDQQVRKQKSALKRHHINEVEIVFAKISNRTRVLNVRLEYSLEVGQAIQHSSREVEAIPEKNGAPLTPSKSGKEFSFKSIERKRINLRSIGTTYVYDYLELFGHACLDSWKSFYANCKEANSPQLFKSRLSLLPKERKKAYEKGCGRGLINAVEIVMRNGKFDFLTDVDEMERRAANGLNECGIVAWRLCLFTPERPNGLEIVVIANDITFQLGSFSVHEDRLFAFASRLARKQKLPQVNISCNSGARIGLASDIADLVCAQFKKSSKGGGESEELDYLYIEEMHEDSVKGQIVYEKMPDGKLKINAVIGKEEEAIGVENLQGSGLIAGETANAYHEVPTYCFVTGRSVGIGAYTARLAHRIVQARSSHLILTGFQALNTLLGQEVYSSNSQLGGVDVMHQNGVTHSVVDTDSDGIAQIVKWLGYLPVQKSDFPFIESFGIDTKLRDVQLPPATDQGCYDVRRLIDSGPTEPRKGICDTGSFEEIMSNWAKSFVTGRARIGGIPIGVLSSELLSTEYVVPADPASTASHAQTIRRAGQVWYPESAFKTAEAINDFNREGLPLLFLASLRGFSGGQRDMYDMVLKFGAEIVNALRNYRMPVIVYIPHGGELRGGAWAVIDSQINPGFIHMVADETSRGGILEPSAIVGLKFRSEKIVDFQKRSSVEMKMVLEMEPERIDKEWKQNADKLYRLAAVEFADLHDRCEAMLAKGAVKYLTTVQASRNLFIWILRVEIVKVHLVERFLRRHPKCPHSEAYEWIDAKAKKKKLSSMLDPTIQFYNISTPELNFMCRKLAEGGFNAATGTVARHLHLKHELEEGEAAAPLTSLTAQRPRVRPTIVSRFR